MDEWSEEAIKRLAKAVRDRRNQLDLTQTAVAAAGGPSPATLSLIENGERSSYGGRTLSKLEKGLKWPSGHATQVLRGATREVVDDWPPPEEQPLRTVPVDTGRPDVHAVVETFARWEAPPKEKLKVLHELLEQAIREMPNGS